MRGVRFVAISNPDMLAYVSQSIHEKVDVRGIEMLLV
jgi:hypothetical protein